METFLTVILVLLVLLIFYCFYQLKRNKEVFNIRKKWIDTDDKRRYKFSYDCMFNPSKYNLYGLKYPNEEDFELS